MGILNITPDSFSDGGRWNNMDAALQHAHDMVAQGADIIDIGGESTRPGAQRVTAEEELQRVVPIVKELHAAGISVSVDTMRANVAAAAAAAGADLINDVSGGQADPDMRKVVADAELPYCIMHWETNRFGDAAGATYQGDNIAKVVRFELANLVDDALTAGIHEDNIVLDPGLGFAKTRDQDWELLRDLPLLNQLGYPVLVGASRKRFLGELLADAVPAHQDEPPAPTMRDSATAAISLLSALNDAWCVRVHDVPSTVSALAVARAWTLGRNPYRQE
ncbi:MAG TPA: dihydropteroate synthase [Corynebacteriales bacterium]|nr:dihydropteroate synthase [Mycobacteriales bacterium]